MATADCHAARFFVTTRPGGTPENSPAFLTPGRLQNNPRPVGTAETPVHYESFHGVPTARIIAPQLPASSTGGLLSALSNGTD